MSGEGNTTPRVSGSEDSPRPVDGPPTAGGQDGYDPQQIMALARHPPPGASVYSPTAVPTAALNPRSCVTCRRRKVRCDKHMPCSNCRRAQIPCIFPAPGRAPRRPRPKDPNAPAKQPASERELELVKRLRKLEGIVEELSGQIELESGRQSQSAGNSPEGPIYARDDHNLGVRLAAGASRMSACSGSTGTDSPTATGPRLPPRPASAALSESESYGKGSPDLHRQFGRLVLGDRGVTRYVSSALWSSINDELDELRKASHQLSEQSTDESDVEATPESTDNHKTLTDHQSFVFGYRSADVDLRPLHPLPSQIPFIWQVFQENVDPILKVIHVPTMDRAIKDLRHNLDSLTPSTEALMFAIYYASITSLDEEEVKLNFDTEKSVLVQKYRFAVEQALAKAEFITKPNFTVLQAFMLFLVLVRRHDDSRFAWTLTGLLIRLSQALGLHRDGTHFSNLPPFKTEMRRRLFWAVCVLDLRSAEDQGTDLTIVPGTFDTQIPLNINDSDISPESTSLPEPREGTTDMAFSLIRYEICALSRRLHTVTSGMAPLYPGDAGMTLEEREALLMEVSQRAQERLLKDSSNYMFWVASTATRIIVAKMTLVIYQPVLLPGPGNHALSDEVRSRLLNAALDVFEYSHILNTDPRCKQWRWLFQTWSHWHALAYTLVEVSQRPWGPKTERIWTALNLTFQSPNPAELEKLANDHAVWMPIRKLYLKVKKHREAELERLKADPQAARELESQDRLRTPPSSLTNKEGSMKAAVASDRWRKLVNLPPLPPGAHLPQPPPGPHFPAQRSQTMPATGTLNPNQVAVADLATPAVMGHLDDAMSHPSFIATDFGAVWDSTHLDDAARTALFGYYPHSDLAGVEGSPALGFNPDTPTIPDLHPMGGLATTVSMPSHVATPTAQQFGQQGVAQTPANSGADDNYPPWLWPTDGSPDILRMPDSVPEELDVNMDDGFDWQTWQESLGRYDVTGSAWGPGI